MCNIPGYRDIARALSLLRYMKKALISFETEHLQAVLRIAFAVGDLPVLKSLSDSIREDRITLSSQDFNALIGLALEFDDFELAESFFLELQFASSGPDPYTFALQVGISIYTFYVDSSSFAVLCNVENSDVFFLCVGRTCYALWLYSQTVFFSAQGDLESAYSSIVECVESDFKLYGIALCSFLQV